MSACSGIQGLWRWAGQTDGLERFERMIAALVRGQAPRMLLAKDNVLGTD